MTQRIRLVHVTVHVCMKGVCTRVFILHINGSLTSARRDDCSDTGLVHRQPRRGTMATGDNAETLDQIMTTLSDNRRWITELESQDTFSMKASPFSSPRDCSIFVVVSLSVCLPPSLFSPCPPAPRPTIHSRMSYLASISCEPSPSTIHNTDKHANICPSM